MEKYFWPAEERLVFQKILCPVKLFSLILLLKKTDPSGRAVYGMGLRPLACWYCVFESRQRQGCLSLVSVMFCQVEVSATGWSLVQRSVSECDREASIMRRPWTTRSCCTLGEKIATFKNTCSKFLSSSKGYGPGPVTFIFLLQTLWSISAGWTGGLSFLTVRGLPQKNVVSQITGRLNVMKSQER
jgi:hypothetical protein